MNDRKFTYFTLQNCKIRQVKATDYNVVSWSDFIDSFTNRELITKLSFTSTVYNNLPEKNKVEIKDTCAIVPGYLKQNETYFNRENMSKRSMLVLDIENHDKPELMSSFPNLLENFGADYLLVTSISDTLDNRRFRLYLPLSRDVNEAEYTSIYMSLLLEFGFEYFDMTGMQFGRLFYLPVDFTDKDAEIIYASTGKFIDVEEYLEKYNSCIDECKFSSDSHKLEDPTKRTDLIGSFCRVFDCHDVIKKINEDSKELIYVENLNNRYTYYPAYLHGHSIGGLAVYNNSNYVYSFQQSDKVSDGHSHNSWDLYRIHMFSQFDTAKVNKSNTLMEEFALSIPEVADDYEINAHKTDDTNIELSNSIVNLRDITSGAAIDYIKDKVGKDSNYLYNQSNKQWFKWNSKSWVKCTSSIVNQELIVPKLKELQNSIVKAEDRKAFDKVRKSLDTPNQIKATLNFLAEDWNYNDYDEDYAKYKLIVKNGVIDLKTGKLLNYDKNLRGLPMLDVKYFEGDLNEAEFKSTLFYKALYRYGNYSEEWIKCVQSLLGIALSGVTQKNFTIFYDAEGNTGKSTLLNIIQGILGQELYIEAKEAFVKNNAYKNTEYYTATLKGKRFITVGELSEREAFNEEILKQFTGGDTIQARDCGCKATQLKPVGNIFLTGNEISRFVASKSAFIDRMILVPFYNPLLPDEVDKEYKDKVLANEKDIIFKWLVNGCIRVYKQGHVDLLSEWNEIKQATIDERDWMFVFAQKVIKNIDIKKESIEPNNLLDKDELYNIFRSWWIDEGYTTEPPSKREFNKKFFVCVKDRYFRTNRDIKVQGDIIRRSNSRDYYKYISFYKDDYLSTLLKM